MTRSQPMWPDIKRQCDKQPCDTWQYNRRHPPLQANGKHHDRLHHGFTLLELLVVVVIVAILFTYTTLAIRSDSPEEIIQKEAQRMERLIELALEESILRGEEYALEISQHSYRFLRFYQNQWLPLADDRILHTRELPQDMELELNLEDTEVVIDPSANSKKSAAADSTDDENGDSEADSEKEEEKIEPQIFLLSSGEITPEFDIRFYILGVEDSYIVKGLFDGTLSTEISEI